MFLYGKIIAKILISLHHFFKIMFLISLSIFSQNSYSFSQKLYDNLVSQEDTPSFIQITKKNKTDFDLHYNREIHIETDISSTHREQTFYKCSINVNSNTKFLSNYAFGTDKSSGSGGAICLSQSVLLVSNGAIFQENQAAVGGAICAIGSAILVDGAKFDQNNAYKYGGGVYFQTNFLNEGEYNYLAPSSSCIIQGCSFLANTACELGGAAALSYGLEIYFEACEFIQNKCSFGGGAVSSSNVDNLKFVQCKFVKNIVDAENPKLMSASLSKRAEGKTDKTQGNLVSDIPSRFKGRGGGAVCFLSDGKKGLSPTSPVYSKKQRYLESHHCCFVEDSSTYTGQSFGLGAGHEIILEGYSKWKSFQDRMNNIDPKQMQWGTMNQFVSRTVNNFFEENATDWVLLEFLGDASDEECTPKNAPSEEQIVTPEESSIKYATKSNQGNENITSEVAPPSQYTYVATPITKLPMPSTESPLNWPPPSRKVGTETTAEPGKVFNPTPEDVSITEKYPIGLTAIPDMGFRTRFATPFVTAKQTESIIDTPSPTEKVPEVPEVPTPSPVNGNEAQGAGETKKKFPLALVIGVVAGLLALLALAGLIAWLVMKKKGDSSDESAIEMNEETVMATATTDGATATLTNENPLWTTSVVGNSENPFLNDFEEDEQIEGFFSVRKTPE